MLIEQVLACNLDALMASHPEFTSQMKLSKVAGVGQTTIGRIRRSKGAATIDNVQKIARAFGLSASDLLKPDFGKRHSENGEYAQLATQLVSELESNTFSSSQLRILLNTVEALKSG